MKKQRGNLNILIAEDNQVNLKMLLVFLHDAGYKTVSVSNGVEAIKVLPTGKIDLILMDIHMPGMDGFMATKAIREMPAPYNQIPIVAITAHALSGDKEKCIEAGMNDFISKPVSAEKLVQKLDKWMGIGMIESVTEQQYGYGDKVLDIELLEKISLGNREFLQDLLLTYIEDMDKRLKNLSDSFMAKDTKKAILESHSIKGASLSIGANVTGEAARGIEAAAKSDDLDGAEELYPLLVQAFAELKKEIIDYLE